MKAIFILLITLTALGLSAQRAKEPNLSDKNYLEKRPISAPICDDFFITYIKNCESKYDVVIKSDCKIPTTIKEADEEIIKENEESVFWVKHEASNSLVPFGNEMSANLSNLNLTDQELVLEIIQANLNGDVLGTTSLSEELIDEKGITDVSIEMDSLLGDFANNKSFKNTSIVEYFCGKSVNVIEIISVLTGILNLDEKAVCELIQVFSDYDITILNEGNEYITISDELCEALLKWEEQLKNEDDNCACELIRTKLTANHFGFDKRTTDNECFEYTALLDRENFGNDHNNAKKGTNEKFSEAVRGAAHAAGAAFYADGGRETSHPFDVVTSLGKSTLSYRMVCVDPATIAPSLTDCASCKKQVSIRYYYGAEVFTRAFKGNSLFSGEQSNTVATDWAVFTVSDDAGNVLTSEVDAMTSTSECADEDGEEDSLENLLSETGSLASSIQSAIQGGISIATGVDLALEVLEFANTFILNQGCGTVNKQVRSFFDDSYSFSLEPGVRYTAQIAAGAAFAGRAKKNAETIAYAISDVSLSGYVETLQDESGSVPTYCDCEKLANYAVSSLEDVTLLEPKQHDTDDQHGHLSFWNGITNNAPYGWPEMRIIAGEHIGLAGEWGDVFEVIGCCEVDIPCHADCKYLRGCDNIENASSDQVDNRMTQIIGANQEDEKLQYALFPNPVQDLLTFQRSGTILTAGKVIVYKENGEQLMLLELERDQKVVELDVSDYTSGVYILHYSDSSQTEILKFIK